MPSGPSRDSIGVGIESSDYLQLQVWSNTLCTFKAVVRVRTSSGGKIAPFPLEVAATSNRLTSQATAQLGTPGVIDSVTVLATPKSGETAPTQRGQSYAVLSLVGGGVLACGYVYPGHFPALNEYEEPGPAGGPGAVTRAFKAALTPLGTGSVLAVVPTGAIWRWSLGALITYVASVTVGTRNVRFVFRDASARSFMTSNNLSPTAGQTGIAELAPNLTTEGTVLIGGNVAIESGSPLGPCPAGYDLFASDASAIDVADTYSFEGQVEEWVVPN